MLFSKKLQEECLGFDDRWLMLFGVPAIALFINVVFMDLSLFGSTANFAKEWAEGTYYSAGFWMANRWMIIQLRKMYPALEQVKLRIGLQVLGSVILGVVTGPVMFLILMGLIYLVSGGSIVLESSSKTLIPTLTVTLFMVSVYESIYFYHQLKRSIMEKEAVKRAHIQSQWEGLRNQVNPHFLFNSLNTLMNIVRTDPELARRFLLKMSKVYRYILESREDPLIPMHEELEFIRAYVFLQEERFRGNLRVNLDIPPERVEDYIVPLSLQLLFENAIKHNIISNRKPLEITVSVRPGTDFLEVRNNLQRKSQVIHSTKVGLENLQKRYDLLTGKSIEVTESDSYFAVAIPLISTIKKHVHETSDHRG